MPVLVGITACFSSCLSPFLEFDVNKNIDTINVPHGGGGGGATDHISKDKNYGKKERIVMS